MPQKTTPRKRPGRTGSRVRTPSKSPGAVPPNIEDNDDWAEKRANKEERKQSSLARTASRKSPYQKKTVSTTGKELNADGIQDLYSACIKLSADNVRRRPRVFRKRLECRSRSTRLPLTLHTLILALCAEN